MIEGPTSPADPCCDQPGSLYTTLRHGLSKARHRLRQLLPGLRPGAGELEPATWESLEEALLSADAGPKAADRILHALKQIDFSAPDAPASPQAALVQLIEHTLQAVEAPPQLPRGAPAIILLLGVNGSGKTTTAAKLCHLALATGLRIMLAAGDTFRAAANEQLRSWADRQSIPLIAQPRGADPASVLFDAVQAAQARKIDLLIADTAGRLHTQQPLMSELQKMHRVLGKFSPQLPVETWLVLDAGTGQNALAQVRTFHQAVPLSGLILSKLDGTARGGMALALATEYSGVPIRYLGLGEQAEDLQAFEAARFAEALLGAAP